ncbi:MAG: 2-oxoglutarate dehydrogenase E1 component [Planctomycetes bacterium]|nr:2-oxoglutarate dehydrogenase E1 component [Planctomycetota bacterium]
MATPRAELSVNGWNGEYLDGLYERWSTDPNAVDEPWRQFFEGFNLGARRVTGDGELAPAAGSALEIAHTKQGQVDDLIYHYRDIGHLAATLDPLGRERSARPQLTLESFRLAEQDLDQSLDPGDLPLDNPATLRAILQLLQDTYCRTIGAEFMHIQDPQQRRWLQQRMETVRGRPDMTHEQRMRILRELSEADAFENFIHTRYTGAKRFGIDGGESVIPLLDEIIEQGPVNDVKEFTIGMTHRGRLNVLVNILHKTYDQIFTEFSEAWTEDFIAGGGDVKYHRGYSSDHITESGETIRLTLSPNPSHLEFVGPVVLGRARAKQRLRNDSERRQCVPILIHGDASFPAQGVVAECLNMVRLDGYTVGGAIHIIINNQIGFTTNPNDAHSGTYCTDIAKMTEAPILHVNGDDPEACVFAAKLALEYRQAFKNDVVIDLWCYRRYGHNEGDEPNFTQPAMYARIRKQQPVLQRYVEQLIDQGAITREQFDALYDKLKGELDAAQTRTKETPVKPTVKAFGSVWAGVTEKYSSAQVKTSVAKERLDAVASALGSVPDGFVPHRKLNKLLTYRREAVAKNLPLDWAMGELLAYGTLLQDNYAVRLTGQDVERGTFSHRHAVLMDQATTGEGYDALNHIQPGQARFCIHNSPLTESACVGFEYGYSLGDPQMLVIWEAQFGDFANGAQVYFDQFIASAEVKWQRYSGLTLFLPHGYEGQGPEHSSARPERFLQLCADNNMQVINPTTPAQMFHVLRRQMKRNFRKPLIILTPKSLLRHPKAVSSVDELVAGRFHLVLDDPRVSDSKAIARVVLCCGKVYYDLVAHRDRVGCDDVAVVRIEQLYPLPEQELNAILNRYSSAGEFIWVQEEPKNMGAYRFLKTTLLERIDLDLSYVGRDEHASPAVASAKMHLQEQEKIMITAIGLADTEGDSHIAETSHNMVDEAELSDRAGLSSAPTGPGTSRL